MVVFHHRVIESCADGRDFHLAEDFTHLTHDARHSDEQRIRHNSSCLLPLGDLLLVITYQLLVRLDETLEEVAEAHDVVRAGLLLVCRANLVVFLEQILLDDAFDFNENF